MRGMTDSQNRIIDKLENLMRQYCKEKTVTYIEWGKFWRLVKKAGLIKTQKDFEKELWAVMKYRTKEIRNERKRTDRFGESKMGRAWIYFPLKMLDRYLKGS